MLLTLAGMIILSMLDWENANLQIVSSCEFSANVTFLRHDVFENALYSIRLTFDGI